MNRVVGGMYNILIVAALTFYVYVFYSMFTYINDINEVNECRNILSVQKNVLWGYGIINFIFGGITLLFSLIVLFAILVN